MKDDNTQKSNGLTESREDVKFTIMDSNEFTAYEVDFNKVRTVEDVIAIIKGLNIHISVPTGGANQFEHMMHLLKERDVKE